MQAMPWAVVPEDDKEAEKVPTLFFHTLGQAENKQAWCRSPPLPENTRMSFVCQQAATGFVVVPAPRWVFVLPIGCPCWRTLLGLGAV